MGVLCPPAEYYAFVVVDIQERLARAMPELDPALETMMKAMRAAGLLAVDVFITEQYPKGLGPTLPQLRELLPEQAKMFSKTAFSCWGQVDFASAIDRVRPQALVLMGMETHVCVQQTALEARKRGYKVIVLADAVCSRKRADQDVALDLMRTEGIVVTTLEALLFDWVGNAAASTFKEVSRIVK